MSNGPADDQDSWDAMHRWYLRRLEEADKARRRSMTARGGLFGDAASRGVDPGFARPATFENVDPGFSRGLGYSGQDLDPGFSTSLDVATRRPFKSALATTTPMRDTSVAPRPIGTGSPTYGHETRAPASRSKHPGMRLDEAFRTFLTGPPPLNPSETISGRAGRLNPSRTDVFRRGSDGKLHPIPGWHTTGPYDFGAWAHNIDWRGVGRDHLDIGAAALDGMGVAGLLESLGLRSFLEGSRRFVERHHADPKVIGGRAKQEMVDLIKSFHIKLHQRLNKALQETGLPPTSGGTTGSGVAWRAYFRGDPTARTRAVEVLRRETQKFDTEHGTSILPYLEKELRLVRPRRGPPTK